jgi:protein-tyrosine-phosphatase
MASEMFKKLLGHNKNIEVVSAGTGTIPGMKATEHTINLLQREGIDAAGHRSMPVSKHLIDSSDLILVMERFHKDKILEISPNAKHRTYLLREFHKDPREIMEPEIPDPIGKPLEVYERSFDLIKEGLDNLVKWLKINRWI